MKNKTIELAAGLTMIAMGMIGLYFDVDAAGVVLFIGLLTTVFA